MQYLEFVFQDGWHFVGVAYLVSVIAYGVSGWFQVRHHHGDDE